MLVMVESTWDAKHAREASERFITWPGPPEGAKIVGVWFDLTARKCWAVHEVTDVKDLGRAAADWGDLLTVEHHIVLPPLEAMAVLKEKGLL